MKGASTIKSSNLILGVFFLSASLVQATKVKEESAKGTKSPRIEKYFVDPVKDFIWMTAKERAAFVAFIYNLNLVVESDLNRNLVVVAQENAKKESQFNPALEILKEIFQPEPAHAVAGALIRLGGSLVKAARSNKQVSTFLRQQGERVEVLISRADSIRKKWTKPDQFEDAVIIEPKSCWKRVVGLGGVASAAAAVPLAISGSDEK